MQKSHQTSSTSIDSNDKRIDRLFARLSAIYGHIWQSQYKTPDFFELSKKEWSETLQVITEGNIELAFKACKERYEMPPTLPAFYQLCRSFQPIRPSNYFNPNAKEDPAMAAKYEKKLSEMLQEMLDRKKETQDQLSFNEQSLNDEKLNAQKIQNKNETEA